MQHGKYEGVKKVDILAKWAIDIVVENEKAHSRDANEKCVCLRVFVSVI